MKLFTITMLLSIVSFFNNIHIPIPYHSHVHVQAEVQIQSSMDTSTSTSSRQMYEPSQCDDGKGYSGYYCDENVVVKCHSGKEESRVECDKQSTKCMCADAVCMCVPKTSIVSIVYPPVKSMDIISASSSDTGKCMDTADQSIISKLTIKAINKDVSECAVQSMGDVDDTTQCLHEKTQLSTECCACYGTDVGCMSENCITKCMGKETSTDCLNCHAEYCLKELNQCTGMGHTYIIAATK